jgi:hypothetical protein
MYKKIFAILTLGISLILPTKQAFAETLSVQPIGSLTQLLGISEEQYQEELASGKTPMQIAEEHGMSNKVYLARTKKKTTVVKQIAEKKPAVKKVVTKKTAIKKPLKTVKKATVVKK